MERSSKLQKKKFIKTLSTRKKVGGVDLEDLVPAMLLFAFAWFGDLTFVQRILVTWLGWKSVKVTQEIKGRFSRNFRNLLYYKLGFKKFKNLPNYKKKEMIG